MSEVSEKIRDELALMVERYGAEVCFSAFLAASGACLAGFGVSKERLGKWVGTTSRLAKELLDEKFREKYGDRGGMD